ncbi:MAG: phosphoribosylglycinamide formyltransferase [Muribaculaceae bacterium]|nr:phosphoribosylglycinamide formyltransferase [Muribaculaceae bacterium]
MKRIAIFASGSGSNFEAIVDAYNRGELNCEPALCVCDRKGAYVIERARKLNVPVIVAHPRDFEDKAAYERFLLEKLMELDIDLICLAGYMRLIGEVLLEGYGNRIINIHPSLLPAFKGAHAIKDAFDYGVKVYGVTIHFVDETLDGGKIISQGAFPYEGTDFEELESRIHKLEHQLYPKTINKIISNL